MRFLYPAFLLGALAIGLPIVLHLLRRDVAPQMPFTAVRLLRTSPIERSRRRRLRDILLLLARVTALLLLAAAFARPFARSAQSAMLPLRIVAVDRSFSMGAPGRFERAQEVARAAVDEASFGARVAVVAFDDRAEVVSAPGSAAEARRAIDTLRPGSGSTRYASVISRALDMAGGGPATLIVVTDLQRVGWEGESHSRIPSSLSVVVRPVDAPAANLAVVAARAIEQGVLTTVKNASATSKSGVVIVEQSGREVARATYAVDAGGSSEVVIPWHATKGGAAIVLRDPGGFPADDRRFLVFSESAPPSVLVIVSPDTPGFFLQRALEAAQAGELSTLRPRLVTAAEIAGGRAELISRQRAVVLLSTRSLDRAAREAIVSFVREGGGLFVAASPDVEPSALAGMFGWNVADFAIQEPQRIASLAVSDIRHPVFRPFGSVSANLGNVRFTRLWKVSAGGWQVPARFDDGTPAVLERTEGQGRILLFASDLDRRWNDFPLQPSFVPFVVESVRHVATRAAEPDAFVVGRVPAGVSGEPGIHDAGGGRLVAVNVDERESGTTLLTADEFTSMIEPVPSAGVNPAVVDEQSEARQSLWQYGLALMLVALVAESLVGRA